MLFTIGVAVNGAIRIFLLAPGGFAFVGLGLAGSAIVRVHVTIMLLLGIIIAALLARPRKARQSSFRSALRLIAVVVFLAIASIATVSRAQSFFDEIADGSASGVLDETQRRSSQGGSEFTPARVSTPTGLPLAIVTVMYRPFPQEAHNIAARLTSLEGVVLMVITLVSLNRLIRIPGALRRSHLVTLAFVYSGLFIIAFSTLGNFGILARQRSQLYPLAFVLLCLPKPEKRRRRKQVDEVAEADEHVDREQSNLPTQWRPALLSEQTSQ